MNSLKETLNKYFEAIEKNESLEMLQNYEKMLVKNISELSITKEFFQIEFDKILSIVSKVEFTEIEDPVNIIINIIENTIKNHGEQSILLLNSIKCSFLEFNEKDCSTIFQLFTFSDLCCKISSFYSSKSVDFDYEYELSKKDQEIKNLKYKFSKFPPVKYKPSHFEPDLLKACAKGKLESVQYLIEDKKADINMRYPNNNTLLNSACLNGHLLIVKYLIKIHHFDVECRGYCGRTPLHSACEYDHLDIAKYLIEKQHVNPLPLDDENNTPFHLASQFSYNLSLVKYYLETLHVDKEMKGIKGDTPLHYACFSGRLFIVKYLIETQHVDIHIKNQDNQTPLNVAISQNQTDVIAYLQNLYNTT